MQIPEIWPKSKVFILGGGPSLNKEDLSIIQGEKVVGVNNAFSLGEWVQVCWFGDSRWYEWNKESLMKSTSIIATCSPDLSSNKKIWSVRRLWTAGISEDNGSVCWNSCSGGSAVNFAYHLGAREIVLVGFDMKKDEKGQANWHNEHKVNYNHPGYNPYLLYLKAFSAIAKDAKKLGISIVNTSMESDLKEFPIIPLKDCI